MREEDLIRLIGSQSFELWQLISHRIEQIYDVEIFEGSGGKKWDIEKKYCRGSKTLCGLYAKENQCGFMVIFGKNEREKFEAMKEEFSYQIRKKYDEAETFHDGKWVMFNLEASLFEQLAELLLIKCKPDK